MLLDAMSRPTPPVEVTRRLSALHQGLSLQMVQLPGEERSWWGLMLDWPATDGRWKYVQTGSMPLDGTKDMIVILPLDCSADDAAAYAEAHLHGGSTADVKKMLDARDESNARLKEDAMTTIMDPALQQLEDARNRTFRHYRKLN